MSERTNNHRFTELSKKKFLYDNSHMNFERLWEVGRMNAPGYYSLPMYGCSPVKDRDIPSPDSGSATSKSRSLEIHDNHEMKRN